MNLYGKRRTNSIVSPSPWSVNTVLLVTVFVVTSGLVYYWGRTTEKPSEPTPVVVEFPSVSRETIERAEQAHAKVAAAAEQARRQWQLAEAAKQRYVDRHLQQEIVNAQQPASTPAPPAKPTAPPKPTRVENPEWARLNESLRSLQQRRAQLLLERTPAHPEVQEVADELAELEQTMTGVPRWMSPAPSEEKQAIAKTPATPPNTADAALAAERTAHRHTQFRMELTRLNRYAEQAHQQYEQLAAQERETWSICLKQREAELAPLPVVETVSAADTTDNMLLSTALLAGMAMMVGVGMFAAGASMESPVKSANQVSSSLQMPVVATVTLPGLRPAISGQHRGWLRLASCLGGMTLMAGCISLVYRALAG